MAIKADQTLYWKYTTRTLGVVHSLKSGRRSSVALIYKGDGKMVTAPNSFRPLCRLSNVTKLLERLLLGRLSRTLITIGDYAGNHFRFRARRGTYKP